MQAFAARATSAGSGTVQGKADVEIAKQIDFWSRLGHDGISDKDARASALKFRHAFDDLERRLASQPYLLGDTLTVLDIAWFIYVDRLSLAAYPFSRLHPRFLIGLRSSRKGRNSPRRSNYRLPLAKGLLRRGMSMHALANHWKWSRSFDGTSRTTG